jgi:hypothetical protein
MTVASQTRSDDENPRHAKASTTDDMSDVTPPTRGNGGNFDHGMVEKVIKFRFTPGLPGKQQVAPSLIHTHWIQAVQEALGTDIEIFNNRSQKVEKIDILHWSSNPLIHQRQFKVYQKTSGHTTNKKTTYFILHRILCTESLKSIKHIPKFKRSCTIINATSQNTNGPKTIRDTTTIGFVTGS